MSYGRLSHEQLMVVRAVVAGREVVDLGAGDGELAQQLVNAGATRVTAIDKNEWAPMDDNRVLRLWLRFEAFLEPAPLVFLSWPDNHPNRSLFDIVRRAQTVIYLGKNTDGTACGWPGLFTEFQERQVLAHAPERRNTLTIYGAERLRRGPTGEEYAGINCHGAWFSFEQAEKLGAGWSETREAQRQA